MKSLLEFGWAFTVAGVSVFIYTLCVLEIYESKRPFQGDLPAEQKTQTHHLITKMSFVGACLVGAFFGACKVWSSP